MSLSSEDQRSVAKVRYCPERRIILATTPPADPAEPSTAGPWNKLIGAYHPSHSSVIRLKDAEILQIKRLEPWQGFCKKQVEPSPEI
jgi:hypothetical protein